MKISHQQLKKIVREELEKEQLTEEQLQELFDGIKAGLQAGKQEFAYRRALKNIQGVLNKSVLPTFDKMLKTYQQLSKEQYDFPQVNSQFKKTLDTILKELDSVVAALPDDESQNLKRNLATKKQELETASAALKALPKADKDAAAAAEKAKAVVQPQAVAAPTASQPAAKRDDKQQVDEVFGDIKKAFQQGALARKSANYVQDLRKMVDTVKPALLNLRKLSPVLKAQKQAVEDPIAIKKAQDAKTAEPEALPSAGNGLNATAPETAKPTPSATQPTQASTTDTGSQTQAPGPATTDATTPPASGAENVAQASGEATTSATAAPAGETETAADNNTSNPNAEAEQKKKDFIDNDPEVKKAKEALTQADGGVLDDKLKAVQLARINAGERYDQENPLTVKESKKPVSYNKLYENWKRFTKG